jgi:hypothetical protein
MAGPISGLNSFITAETRDGRFIAAFRIRTPISENRGNLQTEFESSVGSHPVHGLGVISETEKSPATFRGLAGRLCTRAPDQPFDPGQIDRFLAPVSGSCAPISEFFGDRRLRPVRQFAFAPTSYQPPGLLRVTPPCMGLRPRTRISVAPDRSHR